MTKAKKPAHPKPLAYVANVTREGPYWLATFPDTGGTATFAKSESKLWGNANEAIQGVLEAYLDLGRVPPKPRLKPGKGRILCVIPAKLAKAVRAVWERK